MKGILIFLTGLVLFQVPASAQVGGINLGISVSDGKLQNFYLAIGDYYRVQPRVVVDIRERYRLPDEELPVVFFLAARARVEPAVIINLRSRRMSWLDICFHYGLTPDIFFVPVTSQRVGPPYGHAYGYYRKYGPAHDWKKVVLSDREVVDLVNLKFMSEHYGMTPDAVMEMRGRESTFVAINDDIKKGKDKGKPGKQDQDQKGRGKNKKKR